MDIMDTKIKELQNKDITLASKSELQAHEDNKTNPHSVTKSQVGLGNVANTRQMNMVMSDVKDGNIPVFDGNGYSLRDSGFTIEKSVPADAKFTDTTFTNMSQLVNDVGYITTAPQSDWNVTDEMSESYILNKPESLPASDVFDWAKAPTKPSYNWNEIENSPTTLSGYGIKIGRAHV